MPLEYAGLAESSAIRGEVKLAVEEEGLSLIAPLRAYHLPYSTISALEAANYRVNLQTEDGVFTLSRLGSAYEAFYEELYAAYNSKVRKALFVGGAPLLTVRGDYGYTEAGQTAKGSAPIAVYADCVLILPPDEGARRIPLCFVSSMEKGAFSLRLGLDTGETYSFTRLGYDTEPFADCVSKCLSDLREKALQGVKALDGSLRPSQQAALAALMPEGAAAPIGRLREISPSFAAALEERIAQSRSAEEYLSFKEMGDPLQISVGMKSGLAGEDAENILWMIAPGRKPGTAAVEFALSEDAAATFLYSFPGSFEDFWRRLNHATEAIAFHRDAIRLREEELQKPEYANYAMALRRNAALSFIRSCYAGRVIHASAQRWRQEVAAHLT